MFWVNSKTGDGVREVRRAILVAGAYVNKRRERRGLLPRPVRAAIIGFPNVGKSALINQLVGKKRAKSEDRPGVTRSLTWIRIGGSSSSSPTSRGVGGRAGGGVLGGENGAGATMELLDSPGIIPAKQVNQACALKLAICNDIGEASYDVEQVAASLVELLRATHEHRPGFVDLPKLAERYKVDPLQVRVLASLTPPLAAANHRAAVDDNDSDDDDESRDLSMGLVLDCGLLDMDSRRGEEEEEEGQGMRGWLVAGGDREEEKGGGGGPSSPAKTAATPMTGEDYVCKVAELHHRGDGGVAARRILTDLRSGRLGRVTLDVPPPPVVSRLHVEEEEEESTRASSSSSSSASPPTRAPLPPAAAGRSQSGSGGGGSGSGSVVDGASTVVVSNEAVFGPRPQVYSSRSDPAAAPLGLASNGALGSSRGEGGKIGSHDDDGDEFLNEMKAAAVAKRNQKAKEERSGDGQRKVVFQSPSLTSAAPPAAAGGSEVGQEGAPPPRHKPAAAATTTAGAPKSRSSGDFESENCEAPAENAIEGPDADQMVASSFEGW